MKKIFILLIFAFSFHSEEAVSQYEEDPFEDFNRIVFNVADRFDSAVLRPTAEVYSEYTPTIVKTLYQTFLIIYLKLTRSLISFYRGNLN